MTTLRDLFQSVASKLLARVDLPDEGSNQHELNGVAALRDFLVALPRGDIDWHYFADDAESLHATGTFTFYDARAKSFARTGRSEWRMYYTGDFLHHAGAGDLLVLARTRNDALHALVFERGSSWHRAARTLFQMEGEQLTFFVAPDDVLARREIEFVATRIIDELGLELMLPARAADEAIAGRELQLAREQNLSFPTTARMAALARELASVDDADADETLLRWLEAEERIFRALEQIVVGEKLRAGFASVDDFVNYSLSVQNRRKSRMGLALQNHLAELFTRRGLKFDAQAFTELRKKPDFLFPGAAAYRDPEFPASRLVMLAAKSSCKERWPQVLTEAARIPTKHLCTLEAGMSSFQTDEMQQRGIRLVIPSRLHVTYTDTQRANMLTIAEFLAHVAGLACGG